MYTCKVCTYSTNDNRNYKRHEKTQQCTTKQNLAENAKNMLNYSDTQKLFECKKCSKTFKQQSSLSRHKKNCKTELFSNDNEIAIMFKQLLEKNKELEDKKSY